MESKARRLYGVCQVLRTQLPHSVVIDMGESHSVGGFRILPRTDRNSNGRIKDFRFFVKETPFKL